MKFKDSLQLPKTAFPMKAELVRREPEILARWEKEGLYARIQEARKDAPAFILHDGPPYANGDVHIGTALNKILKDFVVKSRVMAGFRSPYVPGWDCHGLPIELKVQKEIEKEKVRLTQAQARARCRAYAEKYVDVQRRQFMRLGVLGDWFHPYLTMSPAYESEIVAAFHEMWKKGYVYRGLKPVYWCLSCRTTLAAATAEAEYADHVSPSAYVRFPLPDSERNRVATAGAKHASVLIWTTTPWTLPANLAIALHPDYEYALARVGGEEWLVAAALLPAVAARAPGGAKPEILKAFKGKELEGLVARHPFIARDAPLVLAPYVTLDSGTGCVHTAPGHGLEDWVTGEKYGLKPSAYSPLDDGGRFVRDGMVPEWLVGKQVFEANDLVVAHLRESGALLHAEKFSHSYPHCWRCKHPVIFRGMNQWFVNLDHDGLREKALAMIAEVQWVPAWGRNRIVGMVGERPDWVISRQRAWGVPIPVISCEACGHAFEEHAERLVRLVREKGVDVWFEKSACELLEGVVCPKCAKPTAFRKEEDILDVWFESGVSHRAVLRNTPGLRFPCDAYLEGSDQHRGWFQSALWTALATEGRAPFKAVITHGFLVDLDGKKISKSGAYEKPKDAEAFVGRYGADVVRLWAASENYHHDIPLSEEIFSRVSETYRSLRNGLRILLGNLHGFDPARDAVDFASPEIRGDPWCAVDLWMLSRLARLAADARRAYEAYEFHRVYHAANEFCAVDLSAIYVDLAKDRLYCDRPESRRRRATQTAMFEIASALCRLLAPILSFTAEEAWRLLAPSAGSVHLQLLPDPAKWPAAEAAASARETVEAAELMLAQREAVAKAVEARRAEGKIGKSLEARVRLRPGATAAAKLAGLLPQLAEILIVSQVELAPVAGDPEVIAPCGGKCERCWRWDETVDAEPSAPTLCARCADAWNVARARAET
ncbi:MAG: isoleucine--tRNA ligase [Verrucomicrobiae bacterium]|nr:isoleucine--tRNA ligase [Verrucomicrobiae bacterium]